MIDKFRILVRELIDLEEAELLALSESVKTRQYKKGEVFLKEGDHCNYIGFLNTGFFVLSNLPNENLMVAVFEDKNKNLLYDKDEDVALLKNILTKRNSC